MRDYPTSFKETFSFWEEVKGFGYVCESNAIASDQKVTLIGCEMMYIKFRSTKILDDVSEIFAEKYRR